jgi:hypothetical protein
MSTRRDHPAVTAARDQAAAAADDISGQREREQQADGAADTLGQSSPRPSERP